MQPGRRDVSLLILIFRIIDIATHVNYGTLVVYLRDAMLKLLMFAGNYGTPWILVVSHRLALGFPLVSMKGIPVGYFL